jgi:hypothetical protein
MHRTTFRIDEEILAEAKALAARQHRTLNSVMEEALRRMIATAQELEDRPHVTLVTSGNADDKPLVDISPAGLKKFLDDEDVARYGGPSTDDAAGH